MFSLQCVQFIFVVIYVNSHYTFGWEFLFNFFLDICVNSVGLPAVSEISIILRCCACSSSLYNHQLYMCVNYRYQKWTQCF